MNEHQRWLMRINEKDRPAGINSWWNRVIVGNLKRMKRDKPIKYAAWVFHNQIEIQKLKESLKLQ